MNFRFLLNKSRWKINKYRQDEEKTLQIAVRDLDYGSDTISVFQADNENRGKQQPTDFEVIAFIFAVCRRADLQSLYYIDLTESDIESVGLILKSAPDDAIPGVQFFCERHFNIIDVTDHKKYLLSKLIFQKIEMKKDSMLPKISKNEFIEMIPRLKEDARISDLKPEDLASEVLKFFSIV